jgi:A/G-specific adenine glycosylase
MRAMNPTRSLLDWYRTEARDLPWRRRPDPYRVWISEVMLQQTTVATAGPYFRRFVRRYPGVLSLSRAREEELLALWSGLGYYSRARNLLRAALIMRDRHEGRVPSDLGALLALPGVGRYTAGAILSIGYNRPCAALDGNILRVGARLGAIEGDTARAGTRRRIEALIVGMMPATEASSFNQALMDLGATVCTPKDPDCDRCPVAAGCLARARGLVESIPPPRRRAGSVAVEMTAFAVRRSNRFLLVRRGGGAVMDGMWEFPILGSSPGADAEAAARRIGARLVRSVGCVRHTITKHRMQVTVYEARPARSRAGAPPVALSEPQRRLGSELEGAASRWVSLEELETGGLAVTGTAMKIARLLSDRPRPAGRRIRAGSVP